MTRLIISAALVLTPSPITAPKEAPSWNTPVIPVELPAMMFESIDDRPMAEWPTAAEMISPVSADTAPSTVPPSTPPVELTPIESGMNRLAELGATGWQLRTFGCLAWYESRNDPWAVSATNDRGLWQIHFPLHAWRFGGRDWRDPIANAEVAWDIFRESGWRAWTTHWSCGV